MERLGDLTKTLEQSRRTRPFIRAVIAMGRAGTGGNAPSIVKSDWPGDREALELTTRGVATITGTTTTGAPVATAISDLVSIMGPGSASGGVFARAIQVNLDDYNGVFVSGIPVSSSGVGFTAQGQPAQVKQKTVGGVTVIPRKILLISTLTRQVLSGSNAEALVRTGISEDINLGVDLLLFDANDADGIRPAGLRHGVNVTGATSGGGTEAMLGDLANLAAAVAPLAGPNIVFICSPKQYVKVMLRRTMPLAFPVFSSAGLADGMVMALATNALVVAADGSPRFTVSDNATLHMEDTSPAALSATATPNTVAAPIRSLWQTDSIAVRLTLQMDWALRAAGAVAWTQSVTW